MNDTTNILECLDNIKNNIKKYYIGSELAKQRNISGLSKSQVSEYLNISVLQLEKYENGEIEIIPEHLYALSKLLGVSVDTFFKPLDSL